MKQTRNSNPTLIARETLKQLALLKIPPTPDNYHKLYSQVAGHTGAETNSTAVSSVAPDSSPEESIDTWGNTITELLRQLENKKGTLTLARKKEGINRVLTKFSKDSTQLHNKLKALIDSWDVLTKPSQELVGEVSMASNSSESLQTVAESEDGQINENAMSAKQHYVTTRSFEQLLAVLAQVLEDIVASQIIDIALQEETKQLAQRAEKIQDDQDLKRFTKDFKQLYKKLEGCKETGMQLQLGLLRLLNMLMESTGELFAEDQWIGIQLGKLREMMSKPIDFQVMEQAVHCLEEISQRQGIIKRSLTEAKSTLKRMVTTLITNIEGLSNTTGDYQVKLEQYVDKISKIDDINELNQLLGVIMEETKQMQENALNYRDDFLAAQAEVTKAQNKINQLETELQQMGEKVQEDHLTGVLNRRGLDAAFAREASRSMRHHSSLCFALLDIDNFKQLNDTHGHKVGDDALVYLVESVKDTTRPEDIVSRYGGEEFVILLPNTKIDEAVQVLSRIRRSLTKKFFLNENKRLLITFSAGVAQLQSGESQESIFKRADEALYRAKKGGKNQIVMAGSSTG